MRFTRFKLRSITYSQHNQFYIFGHKIYAAKLSRKESLSKPKVISEGIIRATKADLIKPCISITKSYFPSLRIFLNSFQNKNK